MFPLTATDLLRKLPLFEGVTDDSLRQLELAARVDVFEEGATIFWQGDPCDRVWVLRAGRVKIVYQEESGREVTLELIGPGEAFGGATLFMPAHPATAQTLEPSETLSFAGQDYGALLLAEPEVALRLVRMLGARLHSMLALHVLAGERVERRLAHILLKLAARCGRPDPEGRLITLALSRQDLADMAGTTLETTIRMMSRFSREGLLRTRRGGYIVLLDEERLHELAQDAGLGPGEGHPF